MTLPLKVGSGGSPEEFSSSDVISVQNGGTGQSVNYSILSPVTQTTSFTSAVGHSYLVTLSGAATCTLPTAVGATGQTISVIYLNGSGVLSFATTSAQTINGQSSFINGIPNAGFGTSYTFISDGSNWWTTGFSPGVSGSNAVLITGASGNLGWQSSLNVTHGGTGNNSLTAHDVLIGNGTSAITQITPGTTGWVLTSNGTSADPSFQAPASGGGITGLSGDVTTAQGTSGNVTSFDYGQTNVITPSIGTSQNDWSPTGWLTSSLPTANVIRVTATAYVDITGLVPPTYNVGTSGTPEGNTVTIQCASASTFPIRLVASSASSSAANRFNLSHNVYLANGEGVTLIYDNTAANWRAYDSIADVANDYFGSGKDGNVTASNTTLTRDMYYENLTIPGSVAINTAGFKIFVNGVLDISAASAGSIISNGNGGGNASGTTGGSAGAVATNGTNASLGPSIAGKQGGSGGGGSGGQGVVAGTPATGIYNPQTSSAGGGGGLTTAGHNTAGATAVGTQASFLYKFSDFLGYGASLTGTGVSGASGSGGNGTGGSIGGAGGGSGASGGNIYISARYINRGSSSTADIIQSKGGGGGLGAAGTVGSGANAGGGGGGGGGQGGNIVIFYNTLFGSTITNAINSTGGNGGNGANAVGTGTTGNGGGGGPGGYILLLSVKNNTVSESTGPAAVTTGSQTGGTATTFQANL